jgi:FtsP/CotA-like multicopper oxidase with cupredoxin domain
MHSSTPRLKNLTNGALDSSAAAKAGLGNYAFSAALEALPHLKSGEMFPSWSTPRIPTTPNGLFLRGHSLVCFAFRGQAGKLVRFLSLTILFALFFAFCGAHVVVAQVLQSASDAPVTSPRKLEGDAICARPKVGSEIPEPVNLTSKNGQLTVDLIFRSETDEHGRARFCYLYDGTVESPNLRVNPGDLLILRLKNELAPGTPRNSTSLKGHSKSGSATKHSAMPMISSPASVPDPCGNAAMDATSTNLHFHGLTIPPVCHQDDVLHTSIQPGSASFEYRTRIPEDQPPGLYWYHPHLHGFTRAQVVGGASGAIIVEGIEQKNKQVAGLPERVILIRDEDLLNPGAAPSGNSQKAPSVLLDRDGDARNTGDGSGVPAKDVSLNFVSVPYPDYPPATIRMRPLERQFWRVVNASSITYLNLQVLFEGKPQALGIAGVDGAPVNDNGSGGDYVLWQNHLGVPPGGRTEFIVTAPAQGTSASLITRSVNTGRDGENDPTRTLANIVSAPDAAEPGFFLPAAAASAAASANASATVRAAEVSRLPWLGTVTPIRTRRLYFSERLRNPGDPKSATDFYLTVEGQKPALFDPGSSAPNIVVHQGDVEDWIIENRSQELHDFHIHQVHFLMLEWFGIPINEPFLRDTIPVPFWDGKTTQYPTVRLRMDFRDPNAVGVFPFHCHLLEHEDGGMMGLIRVEPAGVSSARP